MIFFFEEDQARGDLTCILITCYEKTQALPTDIQCE